MTRRRNILVALVTALAVANLAWLGLSRSAEHERVAVAGRVTLLDKPFRNPFPNAGEVRLFVETDYDAKSEPIYSKPRGRILTASQRAEFESLIAVHTISPDEMFAACFIPHHFFRYFDETGRQVGEVQVCFCCAGVQQSNGSNVRLTEGQMLVADWGKLHSFITALGERTDVQCEGQS